MPNEFAKLSATELQALAPHKTVFFFPVGPLEDHGPHLPLGLDLEEAEGLSIRIGHQLEEQMPGWTGIIMPRAPLGVDSNTTKVAITVRPHVLRDWLVDACESLVRLGFAHFVCLSGHLGPRQLTAIEEAGKLVQKRARLYKMSRLFSGLSSPRVTLISGSSFRVYFQTVLSSPFWPDPTEHGGKRDTSVALALSQGAMPKKYVGLPLIERPPSRWKRNWLRRRKLRSDYWGDPSEAQASLGQKTLEDWVQAAFPKMREIWEGTQRPKSTFRSWYSILPPNKSFLKAYLLVFLIIMIIVGWCFINAMMFRI